MRWLRALDLNDSLNAKIWTESPSLQTEIFPPCWPENGMVAAAQAFVGPPALPWALDLVGSRWREPGAVLLMGASYADFFSPRCRRKRRMHLSHYRAAKGPADFQAAFLRWVVDGDADYYDKLANLLRAAGVEPEWAVITDLCRGSFVSWEAGGTSAKEKEVLQRHDTKFSGLCPSQPRVAQL